MGLFFLYSYAEAFYMKFGFPDHSSAVKSRGKMSCLIPVRPLLHLKS